MSAIDDLTSAFREGHNSPVDVAAELIDRIEADTRGIGAFCLLDRDAALRDAEASRTRWRAGRPLGPLDGVPVSVKDLLNVAGWPTRRGSLSSAGEPPAAQDSPAVALLRAAGCVLFGKTTTTEFGWRITSDNPHAGVTRNPVSLAHSPGGSSSGAAAQVAAGWGLLALGSDAGGSVRIPAAYCGLVGFKPSFGAIPLAPQSAFAEYAHLGPLTRDVGDCISAMAVLSGADSRDPSSLFLRAPAQARRPMRIGWTLELGALMQVQPEIAAAFHALLDRLRDAGHVLVEIGPEGTDRAGDIWTVWASRVHESFLAWQPSQRDALDPKLLAVWHEGAAQSVDALSASRARLRDLATRLAQHFTGIDLLLTPTTPTVAPTLAADAARGADWFVDNGFCYPFNQTQQPAISLPLGRDAAGLPFGLQIVGRRYDDSTVLDVGLQIERLIAGGI